MTRWEWPWQDLGAFKMGLALLPPFVLISAILWWSEKRVSLGRPWLLVGLVALSNYLLQVLSVVADPRGFSRVQQIVISPLATSYYTVALDIQNLSEWLSTFHEASLVGHASTHPAGPIVFYYLFLKLFDPATAALVGGCVVGLMGSAGILIMYPFAGLWTADQRVRLLACSLYALVPSLTVFFPEFDQIYPILAMLLILFWVRALNPSSGDWRPPFLFGAVLFLATFFAYNLLVVGAFLVYYGLYWLWRERWSRDAWATLFGAASIKLIVFCFLYLALWAATGYDSPAAFFHALENQAEHARLMNRAYANFIVMDLYDFALGAGIIAVAILLIHVKKLLACLEAFRIDIALTLIGLATILTVDLSGLLRGETARVWLFLQPLLVVPVALELSRVAWPWRLSLLAAHWWVLVCVKAKMSFVEP